jgi:carbonic anhydrase/acetyltransferase-like protein (isoleucine patch superfamily)
MSEVEQQLNTFLGRQPVIGKDVYISPGAAVVGDVRLGDFSSVWYNAVLRGDINYIEVGHHSNVQDNCVLHLADEYPCVIGNYVTVGHGAIVHACTVGNEVLVGMGAIILDGAVIGDQTIIGAGALVTQGEEIPPGSMVFGSPATVVRSLSVQERERIKGFADKYVELAAYYLRHSTGRPSSARP